MAVTRGSEDTLARPIDAIGVIGLGYVGLTEAVAFADTGLRVMGFDVDRDRIRSVQAGQSYVGGEVLSSVELNDAVLRAADCALILADHSEVDYARVVDLASTVVDTRNAAKHVAARRKHVVRL
jgi:UDP-N-acetyl-D-mannosaminuronate dehydrogenase